MFMVVRASAVPFVTAVQFAAGEPIREFTWQSEPWAVVRTTYYFNHLASVRAIEETFPRGAGPKGQPAFAAGLLLAVVGAIAHAVVVLRRPAPVPAMVTDALLTPREVRLHEAPVVGLDQRLRLQVALRGERVLLDVEERRVHA